MGFYKSDLSNDIKKSNSKYKSKQILLNLIYSIIGTALVCDVLFIVIPEVITGNVLYGLLFMISSQIIGLSTISLLEAKFEIKAEEKEFEKYCAKDRINALSDKLKEKGVSLSPQQILDSIDIEVVEKNNTIMKGEEKEEHLFIVDPEKIEYLKQQKTKLRYLRSRATIYSDIVYTNEENGKVKKIKI